MLREDLMRGHVSSRENFENREIREHALDVMMHRLGEFTAAERSSKTAAGLKRNLVAAIEAGKSTWYDPQNILLLLLVHTLVDISWHNSGVPNCFIVFFKLKVACTVVIPLEQRNF